MSLLRQESGGKTPAVGGVIGSWRDSGAGDEDSDVFDLLSNKPRQEFLKNKIIYYPGSPAKSLFLVFAGYVRLSRFDKEGNEAVLDFCGPDEFFGEAVLSGPDARYAEATSAQTDANVMQWSREELARLCIRKPGLGPALLGVLAKKLRRSRDRMESFSRCQIRRRLVVTLLDLGRRFGQATGDQRLTLFPILQETIAGYIGTTREIVNRHMGQLREDGLIAYSRQAIVLNVPALERRLPQL